MKNIFAIAKQPYSISIIITAIVSLLIGYGGNLLAINGKAPLASLNVRLIVIAVLVFICGLINILWNKKRKSTAKSEAENKTVAANNLSTAYQNILHFLKLHKLYRRFSYRKLPWYLVVGEPASGKSSLLANADCFSRLNIDKNNYIDRATFPIQSVWSNKAAAMFELAGRFLDLETEVDKAQLDQLLVWLRRTRGRFAVNGIVLTIKATHFLKENLPALQQRATKFNELVNYISRHLSINLPVYIAITHSDLLMGFKEFFSHLKQRTNETWCGVQLAGSNNPTAQFIVEYNRTINNLSDTLLSAMQRAYEPRHNASLAYFPLQMASVRAAIAKFVDFITQANHGGNSNLLQSICFVSAKQQGAPQNNLSLSNCIDSNQGFALPEDNGAHNAAYFIKGLFQKMILPTVGLAAFAVANRLQYRFRQGFTLSALFLLSLLCVGVWYQDYQQYTTKLTTASSMLKELQGLQRYPLERLNESRSLMQLFQTNRWQWLENLGLTTDGKVSPDMAQLYDKQLQTIFLPYIVNVLRDRVQNSANNPQALYNALKAYLMLFDPKHMDRSFIEKSLAAYWQTQYAPAIQSQLNAHLAALLSQRLPQLTPDTALINQARAILNQAAPAQRIYWQLQLLADNQQKPAIDVSVNPGGEFATVFTMANNNVIVPWLYTAQGLHGFYEKYQDSLVQADYQDNWVLGNRAMQSLTPQDVQQQMNTFYAQDYITYWQALLSQVKIKPLHSLPQAVKDLTLLSGPTSPMRQLLTLVANNTAYPQQQTVNPLAGQAPTSQQVMQTIQAAFQPLNSQSQLAADGKTIPVNAVLTSLTGLRDYLQAINSANNPDQAAFDAAKQLMAGNGDVFITLRQQAARLPEPMRSWVNDIVDQSIVLVLNGAKNYINNVWQNTVYADYQRTLQNTYPFSSNGQQEASLVEFARFFSPKGSFATFFQNYIQPFATLTNDQWQVRQFLGHGVAFDARALIVFQRTNMITQTFFANGSDQPSLQFSLKPVSLSNNALQAQLTVGSQVITYRHDPQRFMDFSWPAQAIQGIDLTFIGLDGSQATVSIPWLWGWSKLTNEMGSRRVTADNHALVTVSYQNFSVTYEVVTNTAINPFATNLFAGFAPAPIF